MIKKLYEKEYGPIPASKSTASLLGDNQASSTKESAKTSVKPSEPAPKASDNKAASAPIDTKPKVEQKSKTTAEVKPDPKAKASKPIEDEYEDDLDWNDNDDGWGDADFGELHTKKPAGAKVSDPPKVDAKAAKNDKNRAGYYAQDLQSDLLNDKNEDKFNKVLSTSKENGGLLASIGLKNKDIANEDPSLDGDSEEAPHNKSDLFDTSKDRIAKKAGAKANDKAKESDEDFDLGFSSIKKQAEKEPAKDLKKTKDEKGDEQPTAEEQRREIED